MDPHDHRGKVRQLADDLRWLEDHCRRQPDLAAHAARLRMAAALVRNVVGPAVDGQPARPLFVAVVGGAGAGKSTVVNLLCGAVVAEANPQAGYTRHPTAFLPAALGTQWPSFLGFLGPLRRLSEPRPGDLDEDVYQVVRLRDSESGMGNPESPGDTAPGTAVVNPHSAFRIPQLDDFVVWDCPDMTTWASTGYVGRLMEVVALADVVVYVASDERYNDAEPTELLHLMVRAGKAVVCCLTKARESDAPALVEHFRAEVLGRLPKEAGADAPPVPCVAIPFLPADVRGDPAGKAGKYRAQLLNQLLVLCPSPEAARRRTVGTAVRFLEAAGAGLLDVARQDLAELDAWRAAVAAGRAGFADRYRREYLAGEPLRRFDRTRDQVLGMLDLPGPGRGVTAALSILRAPYRYARDFAVKTLVRPDVPAAGERAVCLAALAAWLDGLQTEALRRAGSHPVWKGIARGFESGLSAQAGDRFSQVFRSFEVQETDELDRAARAVPDYLTAHPAALAGLRVGAVGIDLAAAGFAVWATWPPGWALLLVPVAVGLSHQLTEVGVRRAVDVGRDRVRDQREALVAAHLSGPLADWLSDWPVSSGSSLERLRHTLVRVPATIRELAGMLPASPPPGVPAPPAAA